MKFRHLSAVTLVVLITIASGCRHRPAISGDYEPRDMPAWKRIFGGGSRNAANSGGNGAGASGISRANGGPSIGGGDLDSNGSLFGTSQIGGPLPGASSGPGSRWQTVVYFAYNKSIIGDSERPKLEQLADYLKRNDGFELVVEGHCDDRGSEEYNRALGERRAIAIRTYLENLGIADSRMKTIAYGEERLANTGDSESDHALNRRGEFVVITPNP